MKTIYEVYILQGKDVLIFTSKEKAYEFANEHIYIVYIRKVNIFTYYFYKLIGR